MFEEESERVKNRPGEAGDFIHGEEVTAREDSSASKLGLELIWLGEHNYEATGATEKGSFADSDAVYETKMMVSRG